MKTTTNTRNLSLSKRLEIARKEKEAYDNIMRKQNKIILGAIMIVTFTMTLLCLLN